MSELLRGFAFIVQGLPDWLAWRIEAFNVRLLDRRLSPAVREALERTSE